MKKLVIKIDTREQKPIDFSFFGVECVHEKLDTGDYSIPGYENEITIDRKFSAGELYLNIFQDYVRFKKELLRMQNIKHRYIVCEFPYYNISEWPKYAIKKGYKFTNQHFMDKINHIQEKYGVEFVFCKDRVEATDKIFEILKDFYDQQ